MDETSLSAARAFFDSKEGQSFLRVLRYKKPIAPSSTLTAEQRLSLHDQREGFQICFDKLLEIIRPEN